MTAEEIRKLGKEVQNDCDFKGGSDKDLQKWIGLQSVRFQMAQAVATFENAAQLAELNANLVELVDNGLQIKNASTRHGVSAIVIGRE